MAKKKQTDVKALIGLFQTGKNLVEQIVTAWHKSGLNHDFDDQEAFEKAVRDNRETLRPN
ncbi:MAG TPA: hypothetical protein VNW97_08065 [Candidatus Saccharimonadales bacterium]|nr:hypothetical protein [Candidatus Saccharimonadales bacterium]